MQARVKDTYFLKTAQSAGLEFIKGDYRPVPEQFEEEISNASFLEIFEEEEIDAKAAADSVALKGKTKVKIAEEGKIEKPKKPAVTSEISASPAAIKLAEAEGIDLSSIEGTGAEGKVIVPDVKKAVAKK